MEVRYLYCGQVSRSHFVFDLGKKELIALREPGDIAQIEQIQGKELEDDVHFRQAGNFEDFLIGASMGFGERW